MNNSSLNFKCEKIFQVDERLIPVNTVAMNETMPFQLENKQLDTGYKLDDNQIEFLTPEYQLKIESSSEENYLQLFTPNKPNVIAIEPMTGAADSFNNNIGLQTLRPKDHYNIEWAIRIKTTNHKK